MANEKSVQPQGPKVEDQTAVITQALNKLVNEQKASLQEAVVYLINNGAQQQDVVMALMDMGYTEDDIQKMFSPSKEETEQQETNEESESELEEYVEEEQEEDVPERIEEKQENIQQLMAEKMTAKKGKELPKYRRGSDFSMWYNRNYGTIGNNDMYQMPDRFRYLPTSINRNTGLDLITGAFNLGKGIYSDIKNAIARKNDPSYNKYSVKFAEGDDPSKYYITAKSLQEAAKPGSSLMTKEQAKTAMKDKSSFFWNPRTNAYSFAFATDPFVKPSVINKQIKKEFGPSLPSYNKMSLDEIEAAQNLANSGLSPFGIFKLGGGTHNTYYGNRKLPKAQVGIFNDEFDELYNVGQDSDNYTYLKNFVGPMPDPDAYVLEENSSIKYPPFMKRFSTPEDKPNMDNEPFGADAFTPQVYNFNPLNTNMKSSGDFFDDRYNVASDYSMMDDDAYFNKTIEEQAEKIKSAEAAEPEVGDPEVKIKSRGRFAKGLDTALDVVDTVVPAMRTFNKFLEDQENLRKFNEIVYGSADEQFGTDIGSKGNWTVLDGILQPNKQTTYMSKKGSEMKNFMDYFKMQYGGGNFPQMQQDNTATNMMSEQEAAALANYLSEIDEAKQILSQTQGQIRIPDVNPYFSFLNNQNLPRGANDSMTIDLSQPRDTVDGMNYMNVLYDYDAREQPKFFGRYNQYLNITPKMVRQGRFIPYKQIGGMNPIDNLRVNKMSESDIQAYVDMVNAAQDEETFFKHFPHLRNMVEMPVRDPALQDSDTNVVIKDGIAYYPKYATEYVEAYQNESFPSSTYGGNRSMIPYFEIGSDPKSVSLMRKLKNANMPFDFGNAFPHGYMDVEEYLQNISPVGRKKQMGGMNSMSDFFMDNDLPMYQGNIGPSETTMENTLKSIGEKVGFTSSGYPNLNSEAARQMYTDEQRMKIANYTQDLINMRGGIPFGDNVEQQDIKVTKQIYDPRYDMGAIPNIKPSEYEELMKYYSEGTSMMRDKEEMPGILSGKGLSPEMKKAISRNYGDRKYGGDPFSETKKRSLRKKQGGQIGNVDTATLQKLIKAGLKFDTL